MGHCSACPFRSSEETWFDGKMCSECFCFTQYLLAMLLLASFTAFQVKIARAPSRQDLVVSFGVRSVRKETGSAVGLPFVEHLSLQPIPRDGPRDFLWHPAMEMGLHFSTASYFNQSCPWKTFRYFQLLV